MVTTANFTRKKKESINSGTLFMTYTETMKCINVFSQVNTQILSAFKPEFLLKETNLNLL